MMFSPQKTAGVQLFDAGRWSEAKCFDPAEADGDLALKTKEIHQEWWLSMGCEWWDSSWDVSIKPAFCWGLKINHKMGISYGVCLMSSDASFDDFATNWRWPGDWAWLEIPTFSGNMVVKIIIKQDGLFFGGYGCSNLFKQMQGEIQSMNWSFSGTSRGY